MPIRRFASCLAAALCAALVLPAAAPAADRNANPLEQHFTSAVPLSFRSERGGRFQPDRLVVMARDGAWAAALPATARARSDDRLDFSGVPLVGPLFRPRMAPQDAEQQGLPVGVVSRIGETLVLDARGTAAPLTGLPLVLTSDLPRYGTVTFEVGRPGFRRAGVPAGPGRRVGTAWLVGQRLVLAGDGQRPPITDWSSLLGR